MYLNNFNKFFLVKKLAECIQSSTPDNLDNVNEMSAIVAWIDTEQRYLKSETPIIQGSEVFTKGDAYPIAVAYRGIFDTLLKGAEDAGFVNNSLAFDNFKYNFKNELNKFSLPAEHPEVYRQSIVLKNNVYATQSPFADGMAKVDEMYTNPENNIATELLEIKEKFLSLQTHLLYKL